MSDDPWDIEMHKKGLRDQFLRDLGIKKYDDGVFLYYLYYKETKGHVSESGMTVSNFALYEILRDHGIVYAVGYSEKKRLPRVRMTLEGMNRVREIKQLADTFAAL